MGRQSEPGPKPGSYILTVEIPADADENAREKVLATTRVVAHSLIPGVFVHFHRVLENRGKHGSDRDG